MRSTRSGFKFASAFAVLAFVGLAAIAPATAADSTDGSSLSETGRAAFQDLARCLNSRDSLDVLYLIDDSSSMAETDTRNVRGKVLARSLQQLSSFKNSVNFEIATFGSTFKVRKSWTATKDINLKTFTAGIAGQVNKWTTGTATDWVEALKRSNYELNTAPGAKSDNACKALVWLTDGGVNIGKGNATKAGLTSLCGHDPTATGSASKSSLADGLRGSGVAVLAVLLRSDSYLAKKKAKDPAGYASEVSRMSYLLPVVEGEGRVDAGAFGGPRHMNFACGRNPVPEGFSRGALLTASDPLALAYRFAMLGSLASNGTAGAVSGGVPNRFVIEPGVASFDLVIPVASWTLTTPKGEVVANEAGASASRAKAAIGDISTVTVTVDSTKGDIGEWSLTRNPDGLATGLYLYSGLALALDKSGLTAGKQGDIQGHISSVVDGKPVDLNAYGSSVLTVSAVDEVTGETKPVVLQLSNDGKFSGAFTPIADKASAVFDVTLKLTTKSGFVLAPIARRFVEPVVLPGQYPSVRVGSFSDLVNRKGQAVGTFTLTGSMSNSGKVCFGKPVITQDSTPERMADYAFAGQVVESPCVEVAKGETKTLTLTVANNTPATGMAQGQIGITTSSDAVGADVVKQDLDFSFHTVSNPAPVAWLVAVLILGSILIAYVIFYAVTYLSAHLVLDGLAIARVPVVLTLSGDRVTIVRQDFPNWPLLNSSAAGVAPLTPQAPADYYGDFKPAPKVTGKSRAWTIPGGAESVTVRTPWNPFASVRALVEAQQGSLIVTSMNTRPERTVPHKAYFDLNPANTFFVVVQLAALRKAGTASGDPTNPFATSAPQVTSTVALGDGDVIQAQLVAFSERGRAEQAAAKLTQSIPIHAALASIGRIAKGGDAQSSASAGNTQKASRATAAKVSPSPQSATTKDNPFPGRAGTVTPGSSVTSHPNSDDDNPFRR